MFISGAPTYNKEGKKVLTGLIAGRVARDGEIFATRSGSSVGSASVPAYDRPDGTTAWITVKGFGHWAHLVASAQKGDSILALGRIESRDYEGKTYTDLVVDYVCVAAAASARSEASGVANNGFAEITDDGELPF